MASSRVPPDADAGAVQIGVVVGLATAALLAVGVYLVFLGPSEAPKGARQPDQIFEVVGHNMAPTLQPDDRIGADVDVGDPRRGDIVVLHPPGDLENTVIQRVVGLPGEALEVRDGQVFVAGRPLDEPYLGPGITTAAFPRVVVAPDSYWVMGDNRGNSRDSRFFGPVPRRQIVAVITSIVTPASRARTLTAGR